MTSIVQSYSCPRCNRGEFRSLPGLDGKAFCPWCGDAVAGGLPVQTPAAGTPGPERPPDGPAQDAPEAVVRDLRERLAESDRRRERAESDLRKELDKKQGIKKAVIAEVGQLNARLNETQLRLQRNEEERRAAIEGLDRLKEIAAQQRAADLAGARAALEEKDKGIQGLEADLEARKKTARELEDARDAARREADQLRSGLAKVKGSSETELAQLRKKLAAAESRHRAPKDSEVELRDLKVGIQDERLRSEKERAELREKVASLQAELEKRDQKIRDLQLLIKTLGERLNDLTSRRL